MDYSCIIGVTRIKFIIKRHGSKRKRKERKGGKRKKQFVWKDVTYIYTMGSLVG